MSNTGGKKALFSSKTDHKRRYQLQFSLSLLFRDAYERTYNFWSHATSQRLPPLPYIKNKLFRQMERLLHQKVAMYRL